MRWPEEQSPSAFILPLLPAVQPPLNHHCWKTSAQHSRQSSEFSSTTADDILQGIGWQQQRRWQYCWQGFLQGLLGSAGYYWAESVWKNFGIWLHLLQHEGGTGSLTHVDSCSLLHYSSESL